MLDEVWKLNRKTEKRKLNEANFLSIFRSLATFLGFEARKVFEAEILLEKIFLGLGIFCK